MLLLGACTAVVAPTPRPATPPANAAAMITAIEAAGARDDSVLQVHPLRSAGVEALAAQARADAQQGDYTAAAQLLDRALSHEPHAPDLLQARAEMAMALGQWDDANSLVREAIRTGPRFGALCARSWQTLAEIAQAQGDAATLSHAQQRVATCRKPDPDATH